MRGNLFVGEDPVEITRPRTIEAELDRRVSKRRYEARLEVHLKIDHQIELSPGERRADVQEGAPASRAIEHDDVVNGSVPPHQRRWPGLQHPCDLRSGISAL